MSIFSLMRRFHGDTGHSCCMCGEYPEEKEFKFDGDYFCSPDCLADGVADVYGDEIEEGADEEGLETFTVDGKTYGDEDEAKRALVEKHDNEIEEVELRTAEDYESEWSERERERRHNGF